MATRISGHFAAVNTLGLKLIGYDANTLNPEGGVIRRETDGKTLHGVLEERAAMPHMVKALAPKTQAARNEFLKRGLNRALERLCGSGDAAAHRQLRWSRRDPGL